MLNFLKDLNIINANSALLSANVVTATFFKCDMSHIYRTSSISTAKADLDSSKGSNPSSFYEFLEFEIQF